MITTFPWANLESLHLAGENDRRSDASKSVCAWDVNECGSAHAAMISRTGLCDHVQGLVAVTPHRELAIVMILPCKLDWRSPAHLSINFLVIRWLVIRACETCSKHEHVILWNRRNIFTPMPMWIFMCVATWPDLFTSSYCTEHGFRPTCAQSDNTSLLP